MGQDNQDIKDKILLAALEDVPFDGWTWNIVQDASEKAGFDRNMADAVFADKIEGVLAHFSDWADRQMMAALESVNPDDLKIRDRVKTGVEKRIEVLSPHKESTRAASAYWMHPLRKKTAAKHVWKTADLIWNWAGDTTTDYNHYTERFLLSGVITTTFLFWLNDKSQDNDKVFQFLDRRIENVLAIGKVTGRLKKIKFPFSSNKNQDEAV